VWVPKKMRDGGWEGSAKEGVVKWEWEVLGGLDSRYHGSNGM